MKISYSAWVDILNQRLIQFEQKVRVIDFAQQTLTLSTGQTLAGSEFTKFKKRVMNKKTTIWISNIDSLLDGSLTEQQLKSEIAAAAGRAVQQKHGSRIRKNLNNRKPWNAGTRGQAVGTRGPLSQEVKNAISRKNSGVNNGMYGRQMSAANKEYLSHIMRSKILAGTFTPKSNNRNTHWDAALDGVRYRSSWEALYQYFFPTAQYENLRLEYDFEGTKKIYIVDFVDYQNKHVIEVKPRELCKGLNFEAKMQALREWADTNGFQLRVIDQIWFRQQPEPNDYSRFDSKTEHKIRKLYEACKKKRD